MARREGILVTCDRCGFQQMIFKPKGVMLIPTDKMQGRAIEPKDIAVETPHNWKTIALKSSLGDLCETCYNDYKILMSSFFPGEEEFLL